MIKDIYHYTSRKNWKQIQSDKFLKPMTRINEQRVRSSIGNLVKLNTFRIILAYPSFIVGVPEPNHSGWAKYGLLKPLIEYSTGEVLLSFPVGDRSGVFVREHKHWSPKECVDLYGVDFFGLHRAKKLTLEQLNDKRLKTQIAKYYNSAVQLRRYDGSYEVPEIWFPHQVSLSMILTKINPLVKLDK